MVAGRNRTRVIEAGDGYPLVLLHGTGGHAENYVRNIARLAEQFHVIAPDLLWHGRSATDGFDPEILPALVAHIVDLLDTLGVERAAIEGQSLGGWVAVQLALRHPERVAALILTTIQGYVPDAGAIAGYEEPEWAANLPHDLEMLDAPTFELVRRRMSRILADPTRLPDEAVMVRLAHYRSPELCAVQREFVTEYLGGETCRRHVVTDELASRIAVPTLVYWGDHNRTPPALGKRLARQIPRGEFHCAADTGHWAQFESAEEHDAMVVEFLGRVLQEES